MMKKDKMRDVEIHDDDIIFCVEVREDDCDVREFGEYR